MNVFSRQDRQARKVVETKIRKRIESAPIEELAINSSYLEVAYLLLHGKLPTKEELSEWTWNITHHTFINESIKKVMDGFHYNAHPMGLFIATLGALGTFYP